MRPADHAHSTAREYLGLLILAVDAQAAVDIAYITVVAVLNNS